MNTDTELKIREIQHRYAISKLKTKQVRYLYYTDTEIPEYVPVPVISAFILPLSECPRKAYNNSYGLNANRNRPQVNIYREFLPILKYR